MAEQNDPTPRIEDELSVEELDQASGGAGLSEPAVSAPNGVQCHCTS